MKRIDKLFYMFSPKIRESLLYFNVLKHPSNSIEGINKVRLYYKKDINSYLKYQENKKIFYKSLKQLTLKTNDGAELAKYFYTDNITLIKDAEFDDTVILICLIKNDIFRLKKFIKHYKNLGVKNFVFIDNNSNDGTFEFLKDLDNIYLFSINEKYNTIRRQAWINKIISYFGFDKWYLIIDSDEFLVYNNNENKKIDELIDYYKNKNIKRARALMIDMYSDKEIFNCSMENEFMKEFSYFDTNSYTPQKHKHFELVTGGMRERVFSKYEKIKPFVIKYPLIYFERGDIQYNSHYSYPFYKNFGTEINMGLLHYKFLPGDLEKIKTVVKEKNYANGSKQYIGYLKAYEDNPKMKFVNDASKRYNSSKDLKYISILDNIDWK